jgi:hypothetical protein
VEEILLGKVFFISRHKYPAITLFTTNWISSDSIILTKMCTCRSL